MRNNPYSRSKPLGYSSRRRQIDPSPASSSRSSRAGIPDQKLIEGSQHSREYNSNFYDTSISNLASTLDPSDGEFQLDSFGKYLNTNEKGVLAEISEILNYLHRISIRKIRKK